MALETLRTKVRNISGARRYFGFLPPHGMWLEDGEEYTVDGDLSVRLAALPRPGKYRGFVSALEDGALVLVSSPSQHYYDATKDETVVLAVADAAVVIVDPEFGPYSSSQ